MQRQAPLVGVFDDSTKADRAIEQLRHLGISDRHIQRHEKSAGWDITHAIPNRKETPEEMKPDFTGMGVSTAETERYEDAYEAGYVLVVVHPGDSREQALHILQDNAAYNYAQQPGQENAPPEEMGAVTPGMRGEDSSQTGIATTAEGVQAAPVDPAAVEADLQHVQQVLQDKYQASEEQGKEASG